MIRRGLEWFGGSVLVYVLVAACSASGGPEKMMSPFKESPWGGGVTKGDGDGASKPDGNGGGDSMAMGDGDGDKMAQGDGDSMTGDGSSGGSVMGDGDGDAGGMMGMIMDPVPDADAAEDGTRIVNLYRTTSGGLRAWEGFYDKVSGVHFCEKLDPERVEVDDVFTPHHDGFIHVEEEAIESLAELFAERGRFHTNGLDLRMVVEEHADGVS